MDGQNNWAGQVLLYDAGDNQVRTASWLPVDVPADIDAASGRITKDEFATLLTLARAAPYQEQGQDGSGGGNNSANPAESRGDTGDGNGDNGGGFL